VSLHSDFDRTSQLAVESSRDAGRPIDPSHHKAEYGKPYPTSLGDAKSTADDDEHPLRTVRNMAGYHAANVSVIELHHGGMPPTSCRPVTRIIDAVAIG
jgi:hypothetical protein